MYLPVMLEHQPPKSYSDQSTAYRSKCTVSALPTSPPPVCASLIYSRSLILLLAWYPDTWDPGPCRATAYLSRKERNRTAHTTNGNRE